MSLLPVSVLRRLGRSRLVLKQVSASVGTGERPSRKKGVGIEFADHRSYQPGDDIRHLDRHVYSRLGEHYTRQFSLYQQIPVIILVDASRSMASGRSQKRRFSTSVAAALGYVALAGGDRLQVGAFSGQGIRWSPRFEGAWRSSALFDWLENLHVDGEVRMDTVVRAALRRIHAPSLVIIISDWLCEGVDEGLARLTAATQEVIGVQVLSPNEVDPADLGSGLLRLVDSETGREIEVNVDAHTRRLYRAEVAAWKDEVRAQHTQRGWRFLDVRSDDDLERVLTVDWRRLGVIT